ncbi:hypothetical protein GCM10011385_17850 [Nitratireductor aestuarii]|uniref:Uncharacterized protein n=1 Tax=Nitratireductor aestuarii TaxID=1735103 RepID=A0A916W4A2_9HYPH|nr:hypothetical protein [Nitratireductor aestuarii]GGA64508.1 hypothetical protein GCM10011385_17850 [Nitratireductor aestuarii]
MLAQSAEELEGRLNAQRQVMALLLAWVRSRGEGYDQLVSLLEELCISDQQEDPGAVPTAAFAIEGARITEIRQILEEAEALAGRLEDLMGRQA